MEICVRKATTNDYDTLCELFDEIDTLHRVNLPHIFQKPNGSAREKDYYSGLAADENIGFFVVEVDEKLVGFAHISVKDTLSFPIMIPQHYAVIDSIVIKSEFQNHGLGKMLMEKTQAWAVKKGAVYIELNVYEFNKTAISFYERLGYQTSSRKMRKNLKIDKAG